MNEIEIINPFSEEEIVICYAVSDKVYNYFEKLFVSNDKMHTLEIKYLKIG